MRATISGLSAGYGMGGAIGWLVFILCGCAAVAFTTFWIGGAVAALGAIFAFYRLMPRWRSSKAAIDVA